MHNQTFQPFNTNKVLRHFNCSWVWFFFTGIVLIANCFVDKLSKWMQTSKTFSGHQTHAPCIQVSHWGLQENAPAHFSVFNSVCQKIPGPAFLALYCISTRVWSAFLISKKINNLLILLHALNSLHWKFFQLLCYLSFYPLRGWVSRS